MQDQRIPASGHVFCVGRKRGPQWYCKYRVGGKQVQKRLGPSWIAGGPPPESYFTKKSAERTVRVHTCDECGREYEHLTGFVYEDRDAHSGYYAACHGHPEHEVWVDVILGTWGDDDYVEDHRTFSCRIGHEGATAVDATAVAEGKADLFGRKLTREEALADPLVGAFWNVVDLIALEDPSVAAHLAGTVSPGDTDDVTSPRAERQTEE